MIITDQKLGQKGASGVSGVSGAVIEFFSMPAGGLVGTSASFEKDGGDGSKPWFLVNPKISGIDGCSSP